MIFSTIAFILVLAEIYNWQYSLKYLRALMPTYENYDELVSSFS